MNRLEIVQEVVRLGGVYASGPSTTLGQTGAYLRVVKYVDMAYQEVQSLHFDWEFLWASATLSTVSGTSTYTGEADLNIWDVERIFYDYQQLVEVKWRNYHPVDSSNALPTSFVIKPDNDIIILPTPAGSYTITYDYYKTADTMTADTDEPVIPTEFQYVIVGRALWLMGNFDAAEDIKMQGSELYQQNLLQLERNQLTGKKQTFGRNDSVAITVVPE